GRRPRRRIRLDNDARRAQLVTLATHAFSERSYDDVSIDDLARAAGISKGLLYHYFPTKRDLYVAGLRATADELIARTIGAAAPELPPLERMRAGLDAYLDTVAGHARAFVALMRGGIGSDPEVAAVIENVRVTYVEQFLARAGDTPLVGIALDRPRIRLAVRGWIGMVEATSIDWLASPGLDRATVRDFLVDSLVAVMQVALGGGAPPWPPRAPGPPGPPAP
ncbi:MAG TPA: TetR/AcrR family transcriptional regulator, partial [Kofleriaceae bacterium]|nr:TetR/AcrR family transcriptional regulator [Kofleriaceae bacterium]